MSKMQSEVDQVPIRKVDTRARAGGAQPGQTESTVLPVSEG